MIKRTRLLLGGAVATSLTSLLVAACGGDDSVTIIVLDGGTTIVQGDSSALGQDSGGSSTDSGGMSTVDATASTCGNGATLCGTSCTNTDVDPASCGQCGMACATGLLCSAGACSATCATGYATCSGDAGSAAAYCANEQTDNANCGACGVTCATTETCSAGACVTTVTAASCPSGTHSCVSRSSYMNGGAGLDASTDGASADAAVVFECVDFTRNDENCGACGVVCGTGTACVSGACIQSCGALTSCGGGPKTIIGSDGGIVDAGTDAGDAGDAGDGGAPVCVDVSRDSQNCGGCNIQCGTGTTCINSACHGPTVVTTAAMGCQLHQTNLDHPLGVDAAGRVYAALGCSTNSVAEVAVAADGYTFAAPVAIPFAAAPAAYTLLDMALNASVAGVVHVAFRTTTTLVAGTSYSVSTYASRSTDNGVTWSNATLLGTRTNSSAPNATWLQVAAQGTNVIVGGSSEAAAGAVFYRNLTSGVGAFTSTAVTYFSQGGGIGFAGDGSVWYTTFTGSASSDYQSTDVGATFTSKGSPSTSLNDYHPTYAFGPLGFAVTESNAVGTSLWNVAYATPGTSVQTTGLATDNNTTYGVGRALDVDASGSAYVLTTLDTGGVDVQRVVGSTIGAPVFVGTTGALPSNAAIAWMGGTRAFALWQTGSTIYGQPVSL